MPMQGTGSHVCGVYKCGRGPGAKVPLEASSSTELAWDGGSQGIRKPTLLVELVRFQGPWKRTSRDTAEAHDLHLPWVLCILNSNPKNSQDVGGKKK